ncbi:MAG: DUF5995 family protein, partial [Chloroflexota bacterium]
MTDHQFTSYETNRILPWAKDTFSSVSTQGTPDQVITTANQIMDQVSEALQQRADTYKEQKDFRYTFTQAYASMTIEIKKALRNASFKHRIWIALLDYSFAQFYIRALDAYDA